MGLEDCYSRYVPTNSFVHRLGRYMLAAPVAFSGEVINVLFEDPVCKAQGDLRNVDKSLQASRK